MVLKKLDLKAAYRQLFERNAGEMAPEAAAHASIGGEFEAFGVVQREMLRYYGLRETDFLIDVGCGSGRLAIPLAQSHAGPYLGTDLVSELLDHARAHAARPDWRFEVVDRMTIPAEDGSADMVCMFSVMTHLLHEQSYLYLEEARRVLRPGGRIVLSFLEFYMPFHWGVFDATIEGARQNIDAPLNVFIERNALEAWAGHLGLHVYDMRNGSEPYVPLPHPVTLSDGTVMETFGNLGQSICVLEKPAA